MKEQDKNSLLKKFYLAAVLPIVIVLMIANAIYIIYKMDQQRDENLHRLSEDIHVMASQLATPVWQFDEATVSSLTRSLLGMPLVSCVHLEELDSYGQGVRSISNLGKCNKIAAIKGAVRIEEPITYQYEGKLARIGQLVVWVDMSHVSDGLLNKLLNELVLFALYVTAFLIGFTVAFNRTVLNPLAKVRESINFYRDTGIRRAVEWRSKDELGQMITEYNSTLERASSAEDALLEKNKILEKAREEAEKARDEAERSARAKTEFLANMSHEIRTPMNAIIGLSQIMEKGLLDDRQAGYLSRIRNSADILLSLINDILDFSKIDAGHMELEQIIFDINEVVEKAVDVQSISAANKSIAFIVDLAPDLPHKLIGDPVRLNQVLMNLLSNAIKFTEKGKIVLSIQLNSTEGNHIRLQIMLKDTGIGIAEKDQIHLFNAFKQADGSTTRRFGGTGLGLAISQKIVRLMDGEISLISQEGQGSEFYFTANFLVPEDAQTLGEMLAGKMRFLTNSEEKRFNCILVGNGPSVEFIHKSLSQYEVNTTYFADTKQAIRQLSLLKAVSKQVLLWDLSSSNLSIHELMGMLSDLPSMNSIVLVIMVSVKELERDEVHLQRLPHAVVLTKPILITRLINTIVKAMNKPDSKDVRVTPFKEVHESTLLNKELNPDDGSVVDFKQASVLVVEDNHVNQMVARELLEPYGVKVSIVENGQQALNLLQTSPDVFRLILMDIHMPVMDGYEATKAIRKLQIMTPIIALTANATTDERTRCLEVGMNDFLSKPIDQVKLLSALKKWVQYQSGTNLHEDKVAEKNTNGQHQNAEESKEEIYIDILAMQRRFKNNEQIIPRVLKAFEESFDHFEEEFNEAYHHKNNELMYRMAHSLKGSAANISANTLSELAANLEKRVHDGTQKGLLEYAHVVAEKLQKVLIAGRSYTVNKNT